MWYNNVEVNMEIIQPKIGGNILKKTTKISLAAVLATSALTPVMAFAATEDVAPAGFYNVETGSVTDMDSFIFLSPKEKLNILNNTKGEYYFLTGEGKAIKPEVLLTATTNEQVEAQTEDVAVIEARLNVKFTEEGVEFPKSTEKIESATLTIGNQVVNFTVTDAATATLDLTAVSKTSTATRATVVASDNATLRLTLGNQVKNVELAKGLNTLTANSLVPGVSDNVPLTIETLQKFAKNGQITVGTSLKDSKGGVAKGQLTINVPTN